MVDDDGDSRTEEQWIGDIGHRTLERLALLRLEIPTLVRQLELMHNYAHSAGLDTLAAQLYDAGAQASHAAAVLPDEAAVRLLIAATGREPQEYHAQG